MATAEKVFDSLWADLDERQRRILTGRFGLGGFSDSQTLAALGKHYGITRERVRQIEAGALELLKEKTASHPVVADLIERGKKYLKNNGGVAKQDEFLAHHNSFLGDLKANHLLLIVETSPGFRFYPEDKGFVPFYYLDEKTLEDVRKFLKEWIEVLRSKKNELRTPSDYQEHFRNFAKKKGLNPANAENYVKISKRFHTNSYGDVGLAEWPEIKPATMRDHIYLVLKKEQKPLHFAAIASAIGEKNKKRVIEATVHNELIKDPRFVLVGRGMYGLSEFGYQPGTARQVIQRILRERGPMRTKTVVDAVQKERFFKANTILVNLQNKKYFVRKPDGTYQNKK